MKIILQNKQTKIPLNQKIINGALKRLEKIKFFKDYCFSVSIISDFDIKKLNKKYCKKNYPTDVLSFESGDVIISVDTAKKNSKIYNTGLEEEIMLYIIHGILHLLGFDDTKKTKAKIMQHKQELILKKIWR